MAEPHENPVHCPLFPYTHTYTKNKLLFLFNLYKGTNYMQVQVCISIVWAIKLYQLYFVQNASFWQQTFYFVYIFYKKKTKIT